MFKQLSVLRAYVNVAFAFLFLAFYIFFIFFNVMWQQAVSYVNIIFKYSSVRNRILKTDKPYKSGKKLEMIIKLWKVVL